jgi:hypothetical protein
MPTSTLRSWRLELEGLCLIWQPADTIRDSRYLLWSEIEQIQVMPVRQHQLGRASYGRGLNWCEIKVVQRRRFDFPLGKEVIQLNAESREALLSVQRTFLSHRPD